jgi:hypothetical protein
MEGFEHTAIHNTFGFVPAAEGQVFKSTTAATDSTVG